MGIRSDVYEVNEVSNITICEKPDWISWDDIHEVLWKAHTSNRANGIAMRKPSLPGDEIKKEIGENGKMFVALDEKPMLVEFNPRSDVFHQMAMKPMFGKEGLDELMEHVSKVKSEYVALGLIQFADRPDRKTVHLKFGGR